MGIPFGVVPDARPLVSILGDLRQSPHAGQLDVDADP